MGKKSKVVFVMKLYDDASVREKLTVMDKMDVMFDDARNAVPNEYYELIKNLELGVKIKVTVEKINDEIRR